MNVLPAEDLLLDDYHYDFETNVIFILEPLNGKYNKTKKLFTLKFRLWEVPSECFIAYRRHRKSRKRTSIYNILWSMSIIASGTLP